MGLSVRQRSCKAGFTVVVCWHYYELACDCVQVVYFTNSGGEANELAMMMSRLHTGAFDIVTLRSVNVG